MNQFCINQKRIIHLNIPKTYDVNKVQLGIPVIGDEAEKTGLNKIGDMVLSSGLFGPQSKRKEVNTLREGRGN